MNAVYLALDNEMGGIGLEYSLLTVYLAALDKDFKKISSLYLYLKPNDEIYRVCGRAMGINKINLVEHDKIAITYKEGGTKLYNWLKEMSNDGKNLLTPIGHGIYGDVELIIHNLISRGSWEKFTSYRKLDTQAVVQFLKAAGVFTEDISGSLDSLATHFKLHNDINKLHDAEYDTDLTIGVLKELIKLTKGNV